MGDFDFRLWKPEALAVEDLQARARAYERVLMELSNAIHGLSPQALEPALRQARVDYQDARLGDQPTDQLQAKKILRFASLRLFLLETQEERARLEQTP